MKTLERTLLDYTAHPKDRCVERDRLKQTGVNRAVASEDTATMDVLCVDKTGTITMNQLAGAGAVASQEANQDPIDLAFLTAAEERHIFDNFPPSSPFPSRRLMRKTGARKPWSSTTGSACA